MRMAILLAATLLMAVPVTAQANDPVVHAVRHYVGPDFAGATQTSTADVIGNHGDSWFLEIDAEDVDFNGEILLMEARITTDAGTIVLRPVRISENAGVETWRAAHPIDDARLSVGSHDVSLQVIDRNGGQTNCDLSGGSVACPSGTTVPPLTIAWADRSSYAIKAKLSHLDEGTTPPLQNIGKAGRLALDVTVGSPTAPWAISSVTYAVDHAAGNTPATALRAPYVLSPLSLKEGAQEITFTATDRAGRTASFSVDAFVDTLAPNVTVTMPSVTYRNVPFDVLLTVKDASSMVADVVVEGFLQSQSSSKAASLSFPFERNATGNGSTLVRVTDALGNQFLRAYNISTVAAVTDSTINVQVTPAFPLPQEDVVVTFTARQQSGVTDLPFNVTMDVAGLGQVFADNVTVPLGKSFTFTFERSYLPGQYEFNATISAMEGVNETDPSDQVHVGSFEVFIGKTVKDGKSWFIRVDERGQPIKAVSTGGAVFDLMLGEVDGRTVHVFEAGGESLYWDPFQRTTDLTVEKEKEESPAVALWAVVALLGAIAVARRRM